MGRSPFPPKSDQNRIFALLYQYIIKQTSDEKKENSNQGIKMIKYQILQSNTITIEW